MKFKDLPLEEWVAINGFFDQSEDVIGVYRLNDKEFVLDDNCDQSLESVRQGINYNWSCAHIVDWFEESPQYMIQYTWTCDANKRCGSRECRDCTPTFL